MEFPGGDVKLFDAADSGFAIKWYGHSKKLVIQTDNEHYLKRKFASLANPVGSDVVAGASNGVSESKCPYTCVSSDIMGQVGQAYDLPDLAGGGPWRC